MDFSSVYRRKDCEYNTKGQVMSKIKVSELFYSIQGEGRYTGVSNAKTSTH